MNCDALVLVVEASQARREQLDQTLRSAGYSTTLVESGEMALGAIEAKLPDLVILSLQLPGLSGLQVLERMRSIDGQIPVIVMTDFPETENRIAALKLGATDFLLMPCPAPELLARAATHLEWHSTVKAPALASPGSRLPTGADAGWQTTFNAISDCVWVLDVNMRVVDANLATEQLFGIPVPQVLGRLCWELTHGAAGPVHDCPAQRALRRRKRESSRIQHQGKWFETVVDPILDEHGQVLGLVHVVRDETALRIAHLEIRREANAIRSILESIDGPVFSLDRELCYTHFNTSHARVMRALYGTEIRVGDPLKQHMKNEADWALAKVNLSRALAGERFSDTAPSGNEDHDRLWFRISHLPILDPQGAIQGVTVLATDVTEQHTSAQELLESHERFWELFHFNPLHSVLYRLLRSETGEILDWEVDAINESAAAVIGASPRDLCGRRASEIFGPDFQALHLPQSQEVDRTKTGKRFEITFRGDGRHYLITAFLVGASHYCYMALDVTEQRQAEAALQFQQELLEATSTQAKMGGWAIDLATGNLTWTSEIWDIYEVPPDFVPTVPGTIEFYAPESRTRIEAAVNLAMETGVPFDLELVLITGKGNRRQVHAKGQADFVGEVPVRVRGTFRDISEGVAQQAASQNREHQLQALLDLGHASREMPEAELLQAGVEIAVALSGSQIGFTHFVLPDQVNLKLGVWSAATKLKCTAVSDAHYPIDHAGIWADAVRTGEAVIHNNYPAEPGRKGLPEGHFPLHRELVIPVVDEGQVHLVVGVGNRITPYTPEDASLLQVVATDLWRMIQRNRAERELRAANAALESRVQMRTCELQSLNRELEAFNYSISHDLRAPLRTIAGFSEALAEDYGQMLDGVALDYLQRIQSGALHMGDLIEALLKLSRVSSAELALETLDLGAMALSTLQELRDQDPGRVMEWHVEASMFAQADASLVRIVFDNLLRNAWKFTRNTPVGVIRVDSPENGVFRIQDNGAGFPCDQATNIFAPFTRLHAEREFEGTGIGLAIVQRIVLRHGGKIWAKGQENVGATFCFTLPVPELP